MMPGSGNHIVDNMREDEEIELAKKRREMLEEIEDIIYEERRDKNEND